MATPLNVYGNENLSRVKTFVNFEVLGQLFAKVLTAKTFVEYGGVNINGLVITLHNHDNVGINDQYSP